MGFVLSTILQNGRNCDLGLSTGLKFRVTRVSHHHHWGERGGCDSKSVCKRMKPPGLEDKGIEMKNALNQSAKFVVAVGVSILGRDSELKGMLRSNGEGVRRKETLKQEH